MKSCCDNNCDQGRDCPARQGYGHRKVKAGKHAPTDLPPLPIDVAKPDEGPSLVSVALWLAVIFCATMAALNLVFAGWGK